MKQAGRIAVSLRFALGGVLVGLIGPVLATWVGVQLSGQVVNWSRMIQIQRSNPLLWILDAAPLILGLISAWLGKR